MTKKEVYDRFYLSLTPEERKAGPDAPPDYVVHICKEQPKLTREQIDWAAMVAKDAVVV